jgi:hypothetical protein
LELIHSLNEGTTELILENNSLRHSSNLEHFKMKLFHPLDNKNGGNKLQTYRKLKNSYKMEKFFTL